MASFEIRRYTDFPAAMRILRHRQITLLSPSTWDDQNDRNMMEAFQRSNRSKCVLALCFAQSKETYHHWKIYAGTSNGVCIKFDKAKLFAAVVQQGVVADVVNYETIPNIVFNIQPPPHKLPFLKRSAYSDERELRLVWQSATECLSYKDFDIPIDAITEITINPWAPLPLAEEMKLCLKSLPDCSEIAIFKSQLIDHGAWRQLADKYGKLYS
jgi:hypothetical protein